MNNCHHYRQIVSLLIPLLTASSQRRLEATMEDAYSKAMTKEGATPESVAQATVIIAEKAHAYAAKENARRIRQWAEAILEEEAAWERDNGLDLRDEIVRLRTFVQDVKDTLEDSRHRQRAEALLAK